MPLLPNFYTVVLTIFIGISDQRPHKWIEKSLDENKAYDVAVRNLSTLTASDFLL